MNINDLIVNGINEITVNDSLNAPLIKISIKNTSETVIPTDNKLDIKVGEKTYSYDLSSPLQYLNNVSDEFIMETVYNGTKLTLKTYVIRKIKDAAILDDSNYCEEEIGTLNGQIILEKGINTISTNYTNASIEIIYPKDIDLVKYFVSLAYLKSSGLNGSFDLDDIYFKDCFTEVDGLINAEFNELRAKCLTSTTGNFKIDSMENVTCNSIITMEDMPSGDTETDFDSIYPIGSIYISTINTNPATYFGGTWNVFASGRTLVGVDTSQSEFRSVEKTGGSKELQKHKHDIINNTAATTFSSAGSGHEPAQTTGSKTWKNIEDTDITTDYEGTGNSGNLQPYITVYMWKRIA